MIGESGKDVERLEWLGFGISMAEPTERAGDNEMS